ncbi:class IV adenylate cyclase [Halopiger xanaduensis]|uniref:Adenylyl cyclase CyaB n=1 Tax=Halopiger xanaduensis (strain DSM 18323 / JCM 14033 / SH-6) TaxID=797210 RepID=F8D6Q8_HALXS|nr:class IV adenylate cyclase [Halopiger xanaduensis]AEH37803.1 adenylyl cyclase CyaB [Halopiger xanaduensis SH-6]
MYEVEVKVPADPDLAAVRERLERGGGSDGADEARRLEADRAETVVQEDTYYDAPHRSFPETDEALRIRRESTPGSESDAAEDAESRITYKGPLLDDESKSREEIETAVADGEKMDAVLTNLGFAPAATVRKEREHYTVALAVDDDGDERTYTYTITLDAVDDVGEYVEVETDVEREADLETARRGAYAVLESLDLDPDDQIRTSYLGLLLES